MSFRVESLRKGVFRLMVVLMLVSLGCKDGQEPSAVDTEPTVLARLPFSKDFPIVVTLQFNDDDYRFIFDTGCSVTSFNRKHRNLLGDYVETQNGSGSLWQTTKIDFHEIPRDASFKLGSIDIAGNVGLMDYNEFGAWVNEYDGLIGMDILANFIVQIDFTNRQLLLLNSDTKPVPGWGHPFDFQLQGGTPHLHIQLTETVSELFMIDTAAGKIYLTQDKFEQLVHELRSGVNYTKRQITQDTRILSAVTLKDFRLGPLTYDRLPITEYTRSFLGMDFLRRHSQVTLDVPGKKLYLRTR